MKDKGFTLIELITTFALVAIIIIILINIISSIKTVYSSTEIKTKLYIKQSELSNILNEKINNNQLQSYESCFDEEFCYNFRFKDGNESKLIVTTNKIKFDNYIYILPEKTKVDISNLKLENHNDDFLNLSIPIFIDSYPDINFGINLVYLY